MSTFYLKNNNSNQQIILLKQLLQIGHTIKFNYSRHMEAQERDREKNSKGHAWLMVSQNSNHININ